MHSKKSRIDERDIIFARMGYKEGSPEYQDYYSRRPERQKVDTELRSMPEMGQEGTATFDAVNSPIVDACFRFLADIKEYAQGEVNHQQREVDASTMTQRLKGLAQFFRADLVGITELRHEHYYSHRGRHAENYGEPIEKFHKYGIVFAVEMEQEMIYRAPQLPETIAVSKGYIDTAMIGMVLSYYIRELGYNARNHMDGNYLVLAPLVARDAGLGEMGRNGLLVTKDYGPRIRLGVVTTDIPLVTDKPVQFGIEKFCDECEKCAKTCPGKAIPAGPAKDIEGTKRWIINAEECYRRWRSLGTDCGICLAACPFSDQIPKDDLDKLSCPDTRKRILKNHEDKHGIRPYVKGKPSWLE